MGFPRIALVFNVISLWFGDASPHGCPPFQVPHTVDAMTICCHPVFNCEKGHEIVYCAEDGGKDKCVPCGDGNVNHYITSSLDLRHYSCFNMTKAHRDCPIGDSYPTADNESCKKMYCRCKAEDCRHGNVCHICEKKKTECSINEQLNDITGDCEPCREFMYSPAGCGPCLYNETAWRLAQGKIQNGDKNSSQPAKTTHPVVTNLDLSSSGKGSEGAGNTGYIIATDDSANNSVEAKTEPSADSFSMTPVIIVIAIIVFVGIFVALYLYIFKKVKKGDNNSRLVVLYNRLLPNNKYQQRANQGDPESSSRNGNVVNSQNAEGRQTLAVTPMIRPNTDTVQETGDGATSSENPNMAMLKEGGTCNDEGEETAEKQAIDVQQS